jgi:hypothetical protein
MMITVRYATDVSANVYQQRFEVIDLRESNLPDRRARSANAGIYTFKSTIFSYLSVYRNQQEANTN